MSGSSSRRWNFKSQSQGHEPQSSHPTEAISQSPTDASFDGQYDTSSDCQSGHLGTDANNSFPGQQQIFSPPRHAVQMVTPLHYQHGYEYPLLVWLHSAGHNEHQVECVLPHISTRNYVAMGVRATRATDVHGRSFDWSNGVSAVERACDIVVDAVERAKEQYSIHPQRVILAGYGSGATLACQIGVRQSDRFAGVVRMAGRFPDASGGFKNFKQLRARRLPMLWLQAINGVDDDPDAMRQEIVSAQCIRAQVEIRQYRDDDVMNTVALKDIDRWCFDKIISPKPASQCVGESTFEGSQYPMIDFSTN